MGNTSSHIFNEGTQYVLNQLFGYQDAESGRQRGGRLRDAFRRQHAWDDSSYQTWGNAWDLGDHVGNIGVAGQTTYYGDGSNITNLTQGGLGNLSQRFDNVRRVYDKNAGPGGYGDYYAVPITCLYTAGRLPSSGTDGIMGPWTDIWVNIADPAVASYYEWDDSPTGDGQVSYPCFHLSGDFTINCYFYVFVMPPPNNSTEWRGDSGVQLMEILPQLWSCNWANIGSVYPPLPVVDYSSVITCQMVQYELIHEQVFPFWTQYGNMWLCWWQGTFTNMVPDNYFLSFAVRGNWGASRGPRAVKFFCLGPFQRYLASLALTPNTSAGGGTEPIGWEQTNMASGQFNFPTSGRDHLAAGHCSWAWTE